MQKVIVIYFSRSGNTEKMAHSVAEGVESCGIAVIVKMVDHVSPKDLIEYDGIIIGSPVYFGQMAAEIKLLIDKSIQVYGKLSGKVGGAFCSSGGGGGYETTVLSIMEALLIHGMIIQGTTERCHYAPLTIGKPVDQDLVDCVALGKRIGELVRKLT